MVLELDVCWVVLEVLRGDDVMVIIVGSFGGYRVIRFVYIFLFNFRLTVFVV